MMLSKKSKKIAIIGLGYVGLPLAVEFSVYYPVIGFDTDESRIREIINGEDRTLEVEIDKLQKSLKRSKDSNFDRGLICSGDLDRLRTANIFIVTVPTPIDKYNSPDLRPLLKASEMLGSVLKKGDLVIYESTVYPGCTEEECVPVLENKSGLKFNKDFYCGYSPERINPGDKIHTLTNTVKVTSGSTPEAAQAVNELYNRIISVGTHLAPNIKVAEASKVIENAQRDVNISFVNELALIFDRVGIDTNDVLEAAETKYNFLRYQPGLVGGHCISVDPYYLAHKAIMMGYHPQVILSGRKVNDMLAPFVADKVIKLMIYKGLNIRYTRVLILGITFKENCPDIRNTKVIDIYRELIQFGTNVDIYDPWADVTKVKEEYGIDILDRVDHSVNYKAIILAVAHTEFKGFDFGKYKKMGAVIFDTKAILSRDLVDSRL